MSSFLGIWRTRRQSLQPMIEEFQRYLPQLRASRALPSMGIYKVQGLGGSTAVVDATNGAGSGMSGAGSGMSGAGSGMSDAGSGMSDGINGTSGSAATDTSGSKHRVPSVLPSTLQQPQQQPPQPPPQQQQQQQQQPQPPQQQQQQSQQQQSPPSSQPRPIPKVISTSIAMNWDVHDAFDYDRMLDAIAGG